MELATKHQPRCVASSFYPQFAKPYFYACTPLRQRTKALDTPSQSEVLEGLCSGEIILASQKRLEPNKSCGHNREMKHPKGIPASVLHTSVYNHKASVNNHKASQNTQCPQRAHGAQHFIIEYNWRLPQTVSFIRVYCL